MNTIQINEQSLSLITHNSTPVITTELLASLYGTDANNIKNNFLNNASRFIEGKHFFKLESSELKDFKHKFSNIPKNTARLMLWTERGAARHAKMLDTDQAWDVFEKLEDCYFGEQQNTQPMLARQTITPEQQAILHAIVDRRVNGFDSLRAGLWKRHNKHFGIAKYSQLLASRFDDAVVYLETAELRYPKPKEKINDGCYFLMAKDGVVIYQLPISQQAINSELANNKPLLLEHIKQVVGEFVGQQALEHKPLENENNLVMISRDTTNKVMDYFAALRHEINRLDGKLPIAPNLDKDTIVRAVVTDMMDSSRMLVSFDFITGKPQITFVPNDCFVATRDNLAQVIAGGDGVPKKYLPDIIKAAVNRLSGN